MSNARPSDIFNLCQFTFANGRMCGLPALPKHDGLCLTHARRSKPEPREDDLSADLASPAGDFITQIDINHVLGKLFSALASNRVSPRRAGILAYIGCLLAANRVSSKRASTLAYICANLLKSQEGMHDQVSFLRWTAYDFFRKALHEEYGTPLKSSKKPSPKRVVK